MNTEDAWKASVSEARRILGNRGNIPAYKVTVLLKSRHDMDENVKAFARAKVDLEKKLLDLQNGVSKTQNASKDARSEVTQDNYDLDPKNPDDKKKIEAARKVLDKFFAGLATGLSELTKDLDELERSLDHFGK